MPHIFTSKLLSTIFTHKNAPLLVAVGGPGGTGKSTFAKRLSETLPDSTVLKLDEYKTAREERRKVHLFGAHPKANKTRLIDEHLTAIKKGETILQPIYDAEYGDAMKVTPFTPKKWVIVDGEVATYKHFRKIIDFSIFIESDWQTQLRTRLTRDIEHKNYSIEKAVNTFIHSNLLEFGEHGVESKKWCDLLLFCRKDYKLEVKAGHP